MKAGIKTKQLKIGGMTCISCQNKIERKLQNVAGIKSVKVSYRDGTADIVYDSDIISLKVITRIIEKLDYTVLTGNQKQETNIGHVVGVLALIISLYVLLQQFGVLNLLVPSRLADTGMGYGMLFVIGVITSVHCIAMCGGINLSQCLPQGDSQKLEKQDRISTLMPAFLYNFGRVISYTVIGFVLGFAGLLLGGGSDAGLPVLVQGILKLIAGIFMVVMGLNMLQLFPALRKLQPQMPKLFAGKIAKGKIKSKSPFIVGLLNGLMPCGPLQSMQIVALASGNPFVGALSMFMFSMGTVPLMLGLGSIVSALGKKFSAKVMNAGAVLVVVLGLAMISQGGSLSGFLSTGMLFYVILVLCAVGIISVIPFHDVKYKTVLTFAALGIAIFGAGMWNTQSASATSNAEISDVQIEDGKQIINSTLSSGGYPEITVQEGVPVKWILNAPENSLNGCNNAIIVPKYDLNVKLKTGENIIEFTPDESGTFPYSCWMGMIRSNIVVVKDDGTVEENADNGSSALPAGCCGQQ